MHVTSPASRSGYHSAILNQARIDPVPKIGILLSMSGTVPAGGVLLPSGPGENQSVPPGSGRGCVFFNFGEACALRLLVAIYSLRQHYDGPITTFLAPDSAGYRLQEPLKRLGSDVVFDDRVSKSWDRHRLFTESPYSSTLVFDSDLLFMASVDDLWEPIEREGVLVTRFFPPLYGVDGSPDRPRGRIYRTALMETVRHLVDTDTYREAMRRLVDERIDINVGVMGIARPKGNAFLAEWSEAMQRGRRDRIMVLDELLVVALAAKHRHFLADEFWNCPADEFFRRTNLADANIIHYFADGHIVRGIRLGRSPNTWAGTKWFEMYRSAAAVLDLKSFGSKDPGVPGRVPVYFRRASRGVSKKVRRIYRFLWD